ncbi:R3H domain-containing protein 2-like isoform X2 [Cyprinus carpio]|uniref:R3H domain-containing protein 2-like isoform X2 n=1 Tax=Cyprinus carpio TaxID=7962 RepID=A0A9R0B1K3_CYPCA|nr:R3H domain-containing protein 2-like isoform X2 [Cyprinus carpio]
MNTCGHLPVLCVLLLVFQGVFCSEFAERKYAVSMFKFHDDISSGDIFKSFWRNSKQRRSVKFVGDGQLQTQKTKPQFECGDRVLKLLLKHVDVTNIRFYGPQGDLLHLDHLAAFCGVSIKNTNTDVRLLFNYDSCYMRQELNKYVLSLSWYGADLDLSCPVSVTPPSITCKNNGMELIVGDGTADVLSVALHGEWAPLLYVATRCWHRKLSKQGDLIFLVPYTSCGVTGRDGRSDLKLKLKDKVITLSCPREPQREPDVYQKPPTGLPTKAIASQIVEEQAFPVEQLARNAARTPSQHRSPLLPKIPPLPGSFNLAVNFPFSLPIPTRQPHRDILKQVKHVTPALTYAPTAEPTVPSSEFSSNTQNGRSRVSYAQMQQERANPVTKAPKPESHYMQDLYNFEKPASTPQTEPYPASEYQLSRASVPSAAPYQPYGSAQNFPKPNPLQVNPALASLAHYIPPGYFLCSEDNQQPPIHPQMFQPPVPNQPLQYQNPIYQKPIYQKPDITLLAPANPDTPPMKEYSEHQLTSDVASSSLYSDTPLYQPSQHFQPPQYQRYFYQSSYDGRQGSTTPLSPTSQLIPINMQSQTRPYPAFQDSRPFQPQYYQKPSQPYGSIQQPWSTSHFPVKGLSQDSRRFMSASSQTPVYLQYQTGGDQSPNPYLRSVVHTPVTGISSRSQYQPSQFSKLPYPPLRPEVLSGDVSTEDAGSSFTGSFQPRFKSSIPSPPVHLPLREKTEAQVERPGEPRSRKPQNDTLSPLRPEEKTEAQVERPGEPRSRKPQSDTLPLHQFFRRARLPKDVYVAPHFRSTSKK